jgi:hypothetical protein
MKNQRKFHNASEVMHLKKAGLEEERLREEAQAIADSFVGHVQPDTKDERDYMYATVLPAGGILPRRRIVEDKREALNQGSVPACTAFAYVSHRDADEPVPIATRYAMARVKQLEGNMEWGATTRNQFQVGQKVGTCAESLHPDTCSSNPTWAEYNRVDLLTKEMDEDAAKRKIKSFWRVVTLEELKTLIGAEGRTAVISMPWHSGFNRPVNGDLPAAWTPESFVGGHAVKVKGYDDDHANLDGTRGAFLIRNSWSKWWGSLGDFWLPYSKYKELVWDCWTSLDVPDDLPVDLRYGKRRTWATYLIEKAVAFDPLNNKLAGRLPTNREIIAQVYGNWTAYDIYIAKGRDWLMMTKEEWRKANPNVSMTNHMIGEKAALESATLRWNLVATVSMLVLLLKTTYGIDFGTEGVDTIVDGIFGTIGLISLIGSTISRIRANKVITGFRKSRK